MWRLPAYFIHILPSINTKYTEKKLAILHREVTKKNFVQHRHILFIEARRKFYVQFCCNIVIAKASKGKCSCVHTGFICCERWKMFFITFFNVSCVMFHGEKLSPEKMFTFFFSVTDNVTAVRKWMKVFLHNKINLIFIRQTVEGRKWVYFVASKAVASIKYAVYLLIAKFWIELWVLMTSFIVRKALLLSKFQYAKLAKKISYENKSKYKKTNDIFQGHHPSFLFFFV